LGDLGIDGRIMDLGEVGCENVDWFQLAHDRVQCCAFLGMINFGFQKRRKFLDPLSNYQLFRKELAP
jgi:hypothetical protein